VTDQQKRAATALSLAIVALASLFFVWLAVEVAIGSARGDRMPGRAFMLAIASWDALAIALKALPLIISVGLALLGAYKLKDGLFYAIVAVSAVGLLASIYLFLEVSSVSTAKDFWAYSPADRLEDFESFVSAAQKGLGLIGGWFVTVIAVELGIKL
jgi:hypothetical protein